MQTHEQGWIVVAASFAFAAGCFGGGGGGTGGSGGAVAGTGGTGAGNGGTGAGSGVLPVAGTSPVGGAGGSTSGTGGVGGDACAAVDCAEAPCGPGQESYTPEGGCCPLCRPAANACNVDCAVEECSDGHYVIPEGECCPICVRDDGCWKSCPVYDCGGPMVYDPKTCCVVCGDMTACQGVPTCSSGVDCGGAACCDEQGNYFDCYCGNSTCSLNLRCPDGSAYGCAPPTQGAEPPVPPPDVCGCMPDCPMGYFVIASAAGGTWPDGSQRGTFSCSTTLPP